MTEYIDDALQEWELYPPVGLVEDERGRLRFAEGTRLRGVGRVRPLNPVPSCEPARHA